MRVWGDTRPRDTQCTRLTDPFCPGIHVQPLPHRRRTCIRACGRIHPVAVLHTCHPARPVLQVSGEGTVLRGVTIDATLGTMHALTYIL